MNSIIEAQIELKEQQALEKERCKSLAYYCENYLTINSKKPGFYQIEAMRYIEKFKQAEEDAILAGNGTTIP